MLIKEQQNRINNEISRLKNKLKDIESSPNYSPEIKCSMRNFIGGSINSLSWVKHNL